MGPPIPAAAQFGRIGAEQQEDDEADDTGNDEQDDCPAGKGRGIIAHRQLFPNANSS